MAADVKQAFNDFSSRVNITDLQTSLVSSRWQNVLDSINNVLYLYDDKPSLLIGSYKRQTMLKPLSDNDVDLMVVLHYSKNKNWADSGQGTVNALNKFKEILDGTFPQVSKRIDRNCITMTYNEFKLDVVPTFSIKGGYYKIPDSVQKKWIYTDPEAFMKGTTAINKAMNGKYVPLIKMMKAWNQNNGGYMEGFHLECILYKRYSTYTQAYTYSSMFYCLFEVFADYLVQNTYDPSRTSSADRVDTYLTTDDFIELLTNVYTCQDYAQKAYNAENRGDHETAIYYWGLIFGNYFPAYG